MIKRYAKILIALTSISTKRYLENRFNTINLLIGSIINLLITLVLIDLIFSFTSNFNGWTKGEVLLLVGVTRFILAFFSMIFSKGINYLPSYVKNGDLDHLLIKPTNAQFFISLRYIRPFEFFSLIAGIGVFTYALVQLKTHFMLFDFLLLGLNLVCGLVILFSIYFSLACIAFWTENFYSLNSIYYMITSPLSYPTNIYGKLTSFVVSYVLLLGFIVSFPVRIFLDKTYYLTIFEVIAALVLFIFCKWFWNFSLKHYTSASS